MSSLNYLPNADAASHLLVVRTCYNGSAIKCRVFDCNQFSRGAAGAPVATTQFFQMSMLPSGDRKQYFISRVNACVMNHVIVASQTNFGYIRYVLSLTPPTRPSDERPPVMCGHFCLVPRVSVHGRYYCICIVISC